MLVFSKLRTLWRYERAVAPSTPSTPLPPRSFFYKYPSTKQGLGEGRLVKGSLAAPMSLAFTVLQPSLTTNLPLT